MYERILIPTDGSDTAEKAAEQALELAEQFDAAVHALYVIDITENYPLGISTEPVVEALEAEGSTLTESIVDRVPDSHETRAVVENGDPHEQILAYVDEHDIDLIVMGTHGRKGFERYLLGSVTERVVRGANCAVLVIRPEEQDQLEE